MAISNSQCRGNRLQHDATGWMLEKERLSIRPERQVVGLARYVGLNKAYFENQLHMNAVQARRAQLSPLVEAMRAVAASPRQSSSR
jgi:hypothetical protein